MAARRYWSRPRGKASIRTSSKSTPAALKSKRSCSPRVGKAKYSNRQVPIVVEVKQGRRNRRDRLGMKYCSRFTSAGSCPSSGTNTPQKHEGLSDLPGATHERQRSAFGRRPCRGRPHAGEVRSWHRELGEAICSPHPSLTFSGVRIDRGSIDNSGGGVHVVDAAQSDADDAAWPLDGACWVARGMEAAHLTQCHSSFLFP